jgi:hypothetical protein
MRFVSAAVCLWITALSGSVFSLSEVPADVRSLIKTHDDRIRKLAKDSQTQLERLQDTLLDDLKKLQTNLTKRALLDEAVEVRSLLKRVFDETGIDARRAILERSSSLLHKEAVALVDAYLLSSASVSDMNSMALAEARKLKQEELQPLFEKYTQAGDLDTSIVIRDAMRSDPASLSPDKAPEEKEFEYSADPSIARQQHEEQLRNVSTRQATEFSEIIQQLIPKLQMAMEKEAKATRLDEALFLRNLIQALKDGKNSAEQRERLTTAEASAPDSARSVIKESLQKLNEIDITLGRKQASLNLAFSRIIASEVGQTLLVGDLRQSEQALRQYYFLKRETEAIFALHRPEETKLKDESARNLLSTFSEETTKRKDAGFDREQKLRSSLIAKLEELLLNSELPDAEKTALTSVLDFAKADHSKGVMAMRLLRVPKDLPESGLVLLSEYRSELRTILNELRVSQQNAWQELQILLKPVIREQVAGGDFIQAYLIQAKLPHLQSIRFELPVSVARQAYSSHLWDAHLIEVRGDNCFLVSYGRDSIEWLPRNRIKYNEDDPIVVADMRKHETPQGPGIRVTPETELKPGQKAFKFWGSTWHLVTIDEITPAEVRITWDNWGQRKESCPRSDLSLMEDE